MRLLKGLNDNILVVSVELHLMSKILKQYLHKLLSQHIFVVRSIPTRMHTERKFLAKFKSKRKSVNFINTELLA